MRKLIVALLVFALCMVAPAVALEWDDLPTNMMVMIDANYPPGDMCNTYFDVYLDEEGWVVYPGWCVDTSAYAYTDDAGYYAYLESTIGVSSQWNKVNWILNNKGDATWSEIQVAIWEVMGQYNPHPGWVTPVSDALVADADASFIPGECMVGGVLVTAVEQNGQTLIIEVPTECEEPPVVPEFPTMMIPVFLVGSVLVAASVLKRE